MEDVYIETLEDFANYFERANDETRLVICHSRHEKMETIKLFAKIGFDLGDSVFEFMDGTQYYDDFPNVGYDKYGNYVTMYRAGLNYPSVDYSDIEHLVNCVESPVVEEVSDEEFSRMFGALLAQR